LKVSLPRKEYAAKTSFVAKARRMFVDVLKAPQDWQTFARPVKLANIKRPAFQDETARAVPSWKGLT
jgi:hypothetical protein